MKRPMVIGSLLADRERLEIDIDNKDLLHCSLASRKGVMDDQHETLVAHNLLSSS